MKVDRRLALLGAGGHGRVVADAAIESGWLSVVFFDARFPAMQAAGPWPVVGNQNDLIIRLADFGGVLVTIGNNRERLERHRELSRAGAKMVSVIHSRAVVSAHARIGAGSVVIAGAVVNIGTSLGDAVIINTSASIDHDCNISHGAHISPGAHLGGAVAVGECGWIGVGASVRHQITIGADTVVGAGAVVVSNLAACVTAYGCPARPVVRG
jgi:sugar O-acyltransferase (sialic acid O-acetyltransferase NeuD family)